MSERFRGHRLLWLCAGVVLGLVVSSFSPVKPLHAVATDRQDTLAICTCELAGGIEGVFTLDFLTGELRGTVLNATTRQFNLGYVANCAEHLKVEQGKSPKFVIVTGTSHISARGPVQYADSLIYVAELTTGNMAVYSIPYNTAWNQANAKPQQIPLEPLVVAPFRAATAGAAGT